MFLLRLVCSRTSLPRLPIGIRRFCSRVNDGYRIHDGKVAFITGSNDIGGIGYAIARCLAKRGCNVILSGSRDEEKVEELRTDLEKQYEVKANYLQLELSDTDVFPKLYDRVKDIYDQGVDILVNNAAILSIQSIEDFDIETWERDLRINLTAPFYITKLMLPDMKLKGWGRVINISSVMGRDAYPQYAVYCASKHGLNGLTKVTALETLGTGVTCNTIGPTAVETTLMIKGLKARSEEWGLSFKDTKTKILRDFNPSGELIQLDQVGELAAFLCSPSADQVTGSHYPIDAGFGAR